jgi:hypothetical protein
MSHLPSVARNFSSKTLKGLTRKGIAVIGSQAVPAFQGDVYFSDVAYAISDNGTHRLLRHGEIIALSA